MKNIETKNLKNENDKKVNEIKNTNRTNESIEIILNKIFYKSKNDFLIPLIRKNSGKELKNVFNKIPEIISHDSLTSFVSNKINFIKEIKKLIYNKYEIIHILNNYLSKYDISLFKYYIDLYLKYLFSLNNNTIEKSINSKDNIIKDLQEILVWFIICGLLNKDIIDYVFQKISLLQLEEKLTITSFNTFIPLIEILYGKNELNIKREEIAKNYIYLFDRNTSIIKTNISPSNSIKINNGICIVLWFYIYEYCNEKEKTKGTICQIISNNLQKIDVIITNDYDIEVKLNIKELLKEENGAKFKVNVNTWVQLKMQFIDNKIKLFLFQNLKENPYKFDNKTYIIIDKNKTNANSKNNKSNKYDELSFNNFTIFYLNFFMGYEGLVGTILFFNNSNNDKNLDKIPISCISELQGNKINNFIQKISLQNIYFIISPSLYSPEDNKFIDSNNGINAELSFEKNEMNLNSILKIHNYTKNIFYLGGCNNLLPLFEILYNLSNEYIDKKSNENDSSTNYELMICNLLNNLFKLMELIFINKKKNCIEAYENSNHFFETLQLFLENMDERFFNGEIYFKHNRLEKENYLILSLLNLGKYFYEIKSTKILGQKEKHGFFRNILFYPTIIMKFSSFQQDIIFSFFEKIKKENNSFNNSEYRNYFISFDNLSKLLKSLSERNDDESLPSNLYNIIKIIFEDGKTKDNERESLILLYNNHLLSDKIFINIMEIFIIYFDINISKKNLNKKSNKESGIDNQNKELDDLINMRNNSIKYFLYSSNFFVENLLNIMLTTNLYIKKLIINFLRILTNNYSSILEEYFSFVNECNKNYKNKRINKKDFLYFIKENLLVNPKNQNILNEFEKQKNKKNGKENNTSIKKRKSSLEDIINRKHLPKIENDKLNSIKRVKSFDEIKTNKNNKIIDNLTKNKKKKKNRNNKEVNDKNKKRANSTRKKNQLKSNNLFYKLIDKQNKTEKTKLIYKNRNKSSVNLNIDSINKKYEIKLLKKTMEINTDSLQNINNNKDLNTKKSKLESTSQKNKKNKKKQNRNNSNKYMINKIKNDENLSLEEININCDISMILYDWLVQIKYNKKKNNNDSLDKSITIEYINQILYYIVKFLSNMTELEVIYRTLFIFLGQKGIEQSDTNKTKYSPNYLRLLSYFSKSNSFRQLLVEIIVDSYLGFNNDEKTINKYSFNQNSSKLKIKSTKNNEFKKIYNLTKELLIDIYFYKHNISSNFIIYELYNIILKKYNGFQTQNNDTIHKLYIFMKNIFNEIISKYHSLLNENSDNNENNSFDGNNSNNSNNINNNQNMSELKNLKVYKNYIYFFTLFFEFSIVFKNYFKFLNKKNNKSENTYLTFPTFIKEGLIYQLNSENKVENLIYFDEYKLIINDLKEIYDLKNIFRILKISTSELDKTNEIFHLDIETIQKLVNEIVFQKDIRGKFKKNIEILFISFNQSGYFNNFPLINILSLYKCILLNHDNDIKINNNLIETLNDLQNYIISIILLSSNIKKDDSFSDNNLNYDDIQEIVYHNLLFIIRNIIYKYVNAFKNKEDEKDKNDKNNEIGINNINNLNENEENINYESEEEETYENCFVTILNNIISILCCIYIKSKDNQNASNSFLGWKKSKKYKDISLTGINKLIEYYIKADESFFNIDNLNYFSNNNNNDSNFLIIKQRKNLYNNLVEKCKDKSNTELFNYKIFKSICLGREHEIKKKMKLLLVTNQGKNSKKRKQKATNKRYRNLLIKIYNLKIEDENNYNLVEESRNDVLKIKIYRKIKKYLYSYNNSFSNLEAFYSDKNKYFIPYKISNYLSNDQTRKLIVPVLDFYYYLPNFRKFKSVNENMFKKNIANKIYKVNLKIIDKERTIVTPEINNKNFIIYSDICLIKTTHHIRGKLFYEIQKDSLNQNNKNFCLYFTVQNNISKEYLLLNCPDYDSEYNSCFGSLFRNNLNKKDDGFFLEIKLSDINFIFFRKYCFRNNAIELFLNNHKTYYFKFKNTNDRNNFIEKLINILNQISKKNKFKNIKGIDENNKSITIGYYKDIDNNKDYKNISEIKDLWKNNKISTLEYIMWINIYGNRSFRDVAQYPVLPWILNDYSLNNFDSIINLNSIRNFNLPMGMMNLDEKSNQRKEGYIEGYKLMVNDISEEINIKKPNELNNDEIEELKSSIRSEDLNKESDDDNNSIKNMSNEKGDNLKIPNFIYDLEKLYYNLNIEYDRIPYIFGTHYSNPMYVSHYLSRLFPYSFNMIEIQGESFDCAERLFFSVKNAFYSATREKCDLRELIPEFFTLPEIFLNINELNFGKTRDKNYVSQMKSLTVEEEKEENIINEDNIIYTSYENENYLEINDVALPPWTNQSPFFFIKVMKEIFEGGIELNKNKEKYININPWIDLIFGYYQRGIKAQNKGNLFLPYSYDGVVSHRIKEEDILKSRSDYEFMIRYFEIGVTPTKVFEKKCKDKKKEFNYQITYIKNHETFTLNKKDCIKLKTKKKIIYLKILVTISLCNKIMKH